MHRYMEINKWICLSIFVVFVLSVSLSFKIGYLFGGLNKSLTVVPVNAEQLAEAMQGDNFYGKFNSDMLLLKGTIKNIQQRDNTTLIYFKVSDGINVLPQVFCQTRNSVFNLSVGQSLSILTVAHAANRVNKADISLQNCYILQ